MSYEIQIQRDVSVLSWLSANPLRINALQAVASIPGVANPMLVDETEHSVTLRYQWRGSEKFWETDEYLKRFGVCRADWPN